MDNMWQTRTKVLLGDEKVERMKHLHVLVVGVGGVGAYAAEMLCRAGIGIMTILDADTVNESNINRQLVALHSTIGQYKTEVLAKRLLDINPDLKITVLNEFLKDERIPELLDSTHFDYIVDAIDTLSPKVFLIQNALKRKINIISPWVQEPRQIRHRLRLPIYPNHTTATWPKPFEKGSAKLE